MGSERELIQAAGLAADGRLELLRAVASLEVPDCWIAAGAVRNAVWDALHGYPRSTPLADVDVIWFDPARIDPKLDRALEARLAERLPGVPWSVKNQARMHIRNNHEPYADSLDAMRRWPETATSIAARLAADGMIDLCAAHGFTDLLGLILRPTRPDAPFWERVTGKGWLQTWPKLLVMPPLLPVGAHSACAHADRGTASAGGSPSG